MLRDIIRKIMHSKKDEVIRFEDWEKARAEVLQILQWCLSSRSDDLCWKYMGILRNLAESIGLARLKSILKGKAVDRWFDEELLNNLSLLIRDYYSAYVYGLVDNDGMVPVKVLRNFHYKEKSLNEGSIKYVPLTDAVYLQSMGYVKLLIPRF